MWLYQTSDGRQANALHVPVKDATGAAMPNPFASKEFRKASALALDRQRFVDIMEGLGVMTSQMLPPGRVGHLPDRAPNPFDVEAARRAFAAASDEPGFEFLKNSKLTMTIHGPNDRYPNDGKSLEAVAQMWTAAFGAFTIGGTSYSLTVKAAPEPKVTYFANAKLYLAGFLGGGIANGHASSALALYLLPGGLNHGNYGNPQVTAMHAEGASETNLSKSDAILTDALRLALDDYGLVPLFNPMAVWAGRKGLGFTPRVDDVTHPHHIR